MKALAIENERLVKRTLSDPEPSTEELLIRVHAFGINHADLLQLKGKYPPPPGASPILGLEVAGVIEKVGSNVPHFKKGDEVMALLPGGGYAEKCVVHHTCAMPIPKGLSFAEAAAIPEVFLTAYQALFQIGELRPEQWVLIHAGGSGVGTAAIQLVRAFDAYAIATTRSQEKLESCLEVGAQAVIHPVEERFAKEVEELTEGHGVDLILDFVGASYFEENMRALAHGGAIVFISTLGGKEVQLDLRLLLSKWATLTGTTLRNRPLQYKAKLVHEFSHFALSRFDDGLLFPVLYKNFSWTEVEEAFALLASNQVFGKITISIL